MLITLLILLLLSNALTLRKDQSILFSRVVILGLIATSYISWNNFFLGPLGKGIGIYGGLFNITTFSQTFNIFIFIIFIISALILTLTAFYARKVSIQHKSWPYSLLFSKLIYNKNAISNKMGEQLRIIEYSLVIVFILCGVYFPFTYVLFVFILINNLIRMIPQFYIHFLQSLLNRAYTSLEWCLNSPPKPHAFASLPLQSGVFLSKCMSSLSQKFSDTKFWLNLIATILIGLGLRFIFVHLGAVDFLSNPLSWDMLGYLFTLNVFREVSKCIVDIFYPLPLTMDGSNHDNTSNPTSSAVQTSTYTYDPQEVQFAEEELNNLKKKETTLRNRLSSLIEKHDNSLYQDQVQWRKNDIRNSIFDCKKFLIDQDEAYTRLNNVTNRRDFTHSNKPLKNTGTLRRYIEEGEKRLNN